MALSPSTIRNDLKCGKGAISKGEKCSKGPATKVKKEKLTAGRVAVGLAKVAGAVAAPLLLAGALKTPQARKAASILRLQTAMIGKKPYPKAKSKTDWFELPNGPGITEGNRLRRYETVTSMRAIGSTEFSDNIRKVTTKSLNTEAQKVSALIKQHDIKINPNYLEDSIATKSIATANRESFKGLREQLKTAPQLEGFYLDPDFPGNGGLPRNEIFINFRRKNNAEWNPTKEGISKALSDFRIARKVSPKNAADLQSDMSPARIKDYTGAFNTYQNAYDDERDMILALHESAHALDMGVGRKARPTSVVDPKTKKTVDVFTPEFTKQAESAISHYGLSDITTSRNEFFAESFVLYTLEPGYLRSAAPLVYTWVDTYVNALSRSKA